eukprot:7946638-Pyramimonas_sp.AAC.1
MGRTDPCAAAGAPRPRTYGKHACRNGGPSRNPGTLDQGRPGPCPCQCTSPCPRRCPCSELDRPRH